MDKKHRNETIQSLVYDQEWLRLIMQAKESGLTRADVRNFLKSAAKNKGKLSIH